MPLADILGRPLDQVYALRAMDVVAEQDRPLVADRLKDRRRVGKGLYEVSVLRSAGSRRPLPASPKVGR
jgi:hypothetical protein